MLQLQLQNDIEIAYKNAGGYTLVCGCDEAGRGPLCGPVVAAACILPPDYIPAGLNDSKKLTPKKRDLLFDEIRASALTYCIAKAEVEEIDRINILEASLLAMRRAIDGLFPAADAALIDGNVERDFSLPAKSVVHGDALVPAIAAASILAKVARDRLCLELDRAYPQYGIAGHKGYGTAAHMAALREYGAAPIYRKRFIRFLSPDTPDEDTACDPAAIARAKDRCSWGFPADRKPGVFNASDPAIPGYVLDFKHVGSVPS